MAKVFLSYDRDDTERARPIALALEKAGHSVWWDLHIRGGAQYTKVIEEALAASDAVVVLWSNYSVESAWVRDEAAAGRDSGRLVPVMLDRVKPPMGFRQFQGLDFSGWKGRGKPPALGELLASIEAVAGVESETPPSLQTAIEPTKVRGGLPRWAIAIAAIVLLAIAGFLYQSKRNSHGVYTVAVTAADNKARPLARDLLVSLGQLQSAQPGSLRLIGEAGTSEKPDLIIEAADSSNEGELGANLLLMLGKDRSVLWSKDFAQPSGKLTDLNQQIAFTAARVLRCAFEGMDFRNAPLKAQTFKTYLNGCSEIEEAGGGNASSVIPIMRKVIADEPRFTPAWAIMVMAQTGKAEEEVLWGGGAKAQQDELRNMIAGARKVDPDLAEATLAEISLVKMDDFQRHLELVDRADTQSPNNPVVLGLRSDLLRRVGLMSASIDDARRAADLDPLSPISRNSYISALFYAGRFETARQELAKAEQLWPGTNMLLDMKLRYHLRYGDPREALKIAQAYALDPSLELLLNARIDPSPQNVSKLKEFVDKRTQTAGAAALSSYMQAAGEFGWENEVYEKLLAWPRPRDLAFVSDIFFRPTLKKLRSDPRFMLVAKRTGLLDYWQTTGNWPDFCSEPDLPYDCKKEAAKLGA